MDHQNVNGRARQQQQQDVSASAAAASSPSAVSASPSFSHTQTDPKKLSLRTNQSLQTQLAHLYQHHQQNSSHSPYIDFQNVLFSQALVSTAASASPLLSQISVLNSVYSPVSPMNNVLPADAASFLNDMQGRPRPRLGSTNEHNQYQHQQHPSPLSSVMKSPIEVKPGNLNNLNLNHLKRQSCSSIPEVNNVHPPDSSLAGQQGIALGLARVDSKSRSASQSDFPSPLSTHHPPEHTKQGPSQPPLSNNNSKKRRDSVPSLPLHLDMDMQLDSVVPLVTGAGGAGGPSSTLTEFTKRRNWSQRIIEELQDLLCILTPSGKIRYTSPNTKQITGYTGEELLGRMITDFVHVDDSHIFIREFNESIASTQPLRLFFRFRRKDGSNAIFESNGHPHFSDQRQLPSNTTTPVCSGFFMMARLYPTKNVALLDSFLEHKIENERLKRRIAELRQEEQEEQQAQQRARTEAAAAMSTGKATNHTDSPNNRLQVPPNTLPRSVHSPSLTKRVEGPTGEVSTTPGAPNPGLIQQTHNNISKSMPPPAMPGQLTRQNLEGLNNAALRSDSLRDKMARYEGVTHADTIEMLTGLRYNEGERSRGISTGDTSPSLIRGDAGVPMSADRESRGSGERKKKVKVTNEYVCTDCGTLDSPEWRKGPTGPKTLCNACGLRWAKKEKKRSSVSGPSHPPPLGGPVPPVPSIQQTPGLQ